jgi:hypothetical protein
MLDAPSLQQLAGYQVRDKGMIVGGLNELHVTIQTARHKQNIDFFALAKLNQSGSVQTVRIISRDRRPYSEFLLFAMDTSRKGRP